MTKTTAEVNPKEGMVFVAYGIEYTVGSVAPSGAYMSIKAKGGLSFRYYADSWKKGAYTIVKRGGTDPRLTGFTKWFKNEKETQCTN